jgi:hypothetical protein
MEPNNATDAKYTVVAGFDTVTLQLAVNQYHISLGSKPFRKRDLIVYIIERLSVDEDDPGTPKETEDFKLLSAECGKQFEDFALLNDVAVEACKRVALTATRLGEIDLSKLRSLPRPFRMTFRSEV